MNKIQYQQIDIDNAVVPNGHKPVSSGAVYEVVVPSVETSSNVNISVNVLKNTDYKYNELESLNITDVEDSGLASSIVFSSGTTPTVFTYPSYIEWVNDAIEIEANTKYLLAFCNRIGHLVKIKTISNE